MSVKGERYYWLKLQRDFFKRHDIKIVESMPNGKDYILFYLKLLCESIDHEGYLRFNDEIPYNEQMLATITDSNIDVVRSAIKLFTELKMMTVMDDGTYHMREVEKMIGSVANNDNANRQRRFRERHKAMEIGGSNTIALPECYASVTKNNESKSKSIEIDIELDKEKDISIKEKEIDKEKEKTKRNNYQQIADMYNATCVSFPRVKSLSETRKRAIKARLNTYSLEDLQTVFCKAEASDFLKGKNKNNWTATFDWMLHDGNMAKILDGNYDNKDDVRSFQRRYEEDEDTL